MTKSLGWLGLGILAACSAAAHTDESRLGGAESAVTFQRDVRPLIETHCVGCHSAGGIAPFALGYDEKEWTDGPPSWAATAAAAVMSRAMPPWLADPSCHEIKNSRRLSDAEVDVFKTWAEGGFARGDEADYVKPTVDTGADMGEPTRVLSPAEAYTPKTTLPDDYHCFLLPDTFDAESYLVATNVQPGVVHEVHHVILYSITQAQVADAQKLDDAEAGPGYTCFGGSGVGGAQNVGGWVPGMVPNIAPEGAARVLKKGTHIVMQIHYNTSHNTELGVQADKTKAELWLMKAGEKPKYRLTTVPIANLDIDIKAKDANSVQTRVFSSPVAGTLVGVLPHMHTRGKSIEVTLQRDAGDMCLARIPAWDFHWQQGYRYTDDSYIELERGEPIELTCIYDNSASDKEVWWGEGTDDEMCLNYLEIRTPFDGNTLATECPNYHECIAACAQGDAVCVIGCTTVNKGCQSCTGSALASCAVGRCQDEGLAFQKCSADCKGDKDCLRSNCASDALTFFGCMEPFLRDGSCDDALSSCGV